MHSLVSHGDTVTNTRDTEKEGIAATGMNTLFYIPLQVFHADMTGYKVRKAGRNANEGLVHFALGHAGTLQQGAMGNSFKALGNHITSHVYSSTVRALQRADPHQHAEIKFSNKRSK
jgi:hypothetical protein